jgi:hypothetical protein
MDDIIDIQSRVLVLWIETGQQFPATIVDYQSGKIK